jgi:hypothetical protein
MIDAIENGLLDLTVIDELIEDAQFQKDCGEVSAFLVTDIISKLDILIGGGQKAVDVVQDYIENAKILYEMSDFGYVFIQQTLNKLYSYELLSLGK